MLRTHHTGGAAHPIGMRRITDDCICQHGKLTSRDMDVALSQLRLPRDTATNRRYRVSRKTRRLRPIVTNTAARAGGTTNEAPLCLQHTTCLCHVIKCGQTNRRPWHLSICRQTNRPTDGQTICPSVHLFSWRISHVYRAGLSALRTLLRCVQLVKTSCQST